MSVCPQTTDAVSVVLLTHHVEGGARSLGRLLIAAVACGQVTRGETCYLQFLEVAALTYLQILELAA